eukprot:TRINITY_DN14515_c0_g1_i3.p1 TRINITY_DN14515_c0_g1~~TRINITY_DN14515_c0_g1_i3.p1  ORF type:complete len:588 (+),score=49.47 TRINITY_DN14515_c0_g1_i3:650-2413(+)
MARSLEEYVKEVKRIHFLYEGTRSKEAKLLKDISKMNTREKCLFTKKEISCAEEKNEHKEVSLYLRHYKEKAEAVAERNYMEKLNYNDKVSSLKAKLTDNLKYNLEVQVKLAEVSLSSLGGEFAKEYEKKRKELTNVTEELRRYKNRIMQCRSTQKRMEQMAQELEIENVKLLQKVKEAKNVLSVHNEIKENMLRFKQTAINAAKTVDRKKIELLQLENEIEERGKTVCKNGCRKVSCISCGAKCKGCSAYCCNKCMRQCNKCKKIYCPKCNENFQKCNTCGNIMCWECVHYCEKCKAKLCDKCNVKCSSCGVNVCNKHTTMCLECVKCYGECKATLCDKCSITCSSCGASMCNEHTKKCAKCGLNLCKNCQDTNCTECNLLCCSTCICKCINCGKVTHRDDCSKCCIYEGKYYFCSTCVKAYDYRWTFDSSDLPHGLTLFDENKTVHASESIFTTYIIGTKYFKNGIFCYEVTGNNVSGSSDAFGVCDISGVKKVKTIFFNKKLNIDKELIGVTGVSKLKGLTGDLSYQDGVPYLLIVDRFKQKIRIIGITTSAEGALDPSVTYGAYFCLNCSGTFKIKPLPIFQW